MTAFRHVARLNVALWGRRVDAQAPSAQKAA